jgi:hypothetical protein
VYCGKGVSSSILSGYCSKFEVSDSPVTAGLTGACSSLFRSWSHSMQGDDENHLWFETSVAPFLKQPIRFVKSDCSSFLIRDLEFRSKQLHTQQDTNAQLASKFAWS